LRMEFRSFLQAIRYCRARCADGAADCVAILSYSRWLKDLFATFERIVIWSWAELYKRT